LKIQAPTNCPSCSSTLEWRNDLLYCENLACEGKSSQKLEHFAKTLKIKGLGPATIDKLQLESIFDIYEMNLDLLTELLSSEKLAGKLFLEIEGSKSASLQEVLPAFSIPLIGKSATAKLCSVLRHLDELTVDICEHAGLGPKATQNLMIWFREEYTPYYKSLPFSFASAVSEVVAPSNTSMGIVCITGKLSSVKTKAEAERLLVDAGYTTKSSLTKDVTILLNESGLESAKTKKARDAGISIETNLNNLIGVN
jgi:NAD-dependent DNA ligase